MTDKLIILLQKLKADASKLTNPIREIETITDQIDQINAFVKRGSSINNKHVETAINFANVVLENMSSTRNLMNLHDSLDDIMFDMQPDTQPVDDCVLRCDEDCTPVYNPNWKL